MVTRLFPLLLSFSCLQTDALIVGRLDSTTPAGDTDSDTGADTAPVSGDPNDANLPALLVAESPYGSSPNPDTWGGVVRYSFGESGALENPAPGIDAENLHDPWGLAWREASNELFVGNRHGSFGAVDVTGTIQRWMYDGTRTLYPTGVIAGNDLSEVHQLGFDPATGDLFAANGERGIARFRISAAGGAIANGTIESGLTRGVAGSPGGRKVWATSGTEFVRQFDVGTWNERAPIETEPGAVLENLTVHDGMLYAAGSSTDAIYRFRIGAMEDLALVDSIDATSPVCVIFSRDGGTMYSASAAGVIERFAYDANGDTWSFVDAVQSGPSLGSIVIVE
jgi:hypothetical protein